MKESCQKRPFGGSGGGGGEAFSFASVSIILLMRHHRACEFGGMISLVLRGGEAAANAMVTRTKLFTLAESLGGVESLIEVPAAMTHASVVGSKLEVPAGLVRLSVGIEEAEDLIADLEQALRYSQKL